MKQDVPLVPGAVLDGLLVSFFQQPLRSQRTEFKF